MYAGRISGRALSRSSAVIASHLTHSPGTCERLRDGAVKGCTVEHV